MLLMTQVDQIPIDQIHEKLKGELLQNLVREIEVLEFPYQNYYYGENKKTLPPKESPTKYFRFRQYQFVAKPIEEVFKFFAEAKNLERITPSQLSFKIDSQSTEEIQEGTNFVYRLKIHGVPAKWKTNITNWNPPYEFVDWQQKGPYRVWYHNHLFVETESGTLLIDEVKFVLPFRWISNILVSWFIKLDVKSIFKYRYEYIRDYYKA